jgi:leader peptidase (prepilin peptidase)/N-methyltransferase
LPGTVLFIFGALLGSFLNVVIYRVPRGESVVTPPSACPACGTRIRFWDNVPIVSYLVLRGRCRDCGAVISPRYSVVELLSALVPLILYLRFGLGREFAVYWPLSCVLLVLSFIDLDLRILPDKVTLPGIAVGLMVAPLAGLTTFPESLIGAAVGGGALYLIALAGSAIFGKESMGGGDVKLAAMLGAFLGWQGMVVLLFVAFFVGAVVGVVVLALKRSDADHTIPFGPFIALGAFISIVWGGSLVHWYLSTMGRVG